jgi:hypothetical protein
VLVDAGAFQDSSSNPFAGIAGSTSWAFTTWDKTAPTVGTFTPAANASNVDPTAAFKLLFDEAVTAVAGKYITVYKSSDDSKVDQYAADDTAKISISDSTVMITAPALAEETDYYITVDNGAFADTSNNSFAGVSSKTAWAFKTKDNVPTVSSLNPAAGATEVASSLTSVSVTFSEKVTAAAGKYITIRRSSDDNEAGNYEATESTNVTLADNVVTISGFTLAAGTSYYVTIEPGAFTDLTGNPIAGLTTGSAWFFTTKSVVVATEMTAETDPVTLNENNLDAALITLSITGDTFDENASESDFQLNNAPAGLNIALAYVADNQAYLLLEHSWSPFTADITNFSITAKASAMTKGSPVTTSNMTIARVPQTSNPFFSEYLDGQNGRIAVELYYIGPQAELTGYQVDVQQYKKSTNKIEKFTIPLLKITAGMPYILIDSTFYDLFDVTNAWYYNEEFSMYNPSSFVTTALILKKDGQIIDVLGKPDATSAIPIIDTSVKGRSIVRNSGTTGGQEVFMLNHWTEIQAIYTSLGTHTP